MNVNDKLARIYHLTVGIHEGGLKKKEAHEEINHLSDELNVAGYTDSWIENNLEAMYLTEQMHKELAKLKR